MPADSVAVVGNTERGEVQNKGLNLLELPANLAFPSSHIELPFTPNAKVSPRPTMLLGASIISHGVCFMKKILNWQIRFIVTMSGYFQECSASSSLHFLK